MRAAEASRASGREVATGYWGSCSPNMITVGTLNPGSTSVRPGNRVKVVRTVMAAARRS